MGDLGLLPQDVAILLCCPLGATFGSFAHALVLAHDPLKIAVPGPHDLDSKKEAASRRNWMASRLVLGAILGLAFAVYFVGSVQPETSAVAHLIAFSFLIGYAAPKLWKVNEQWLISRLDLHIENAVAKRLPRKEDDTPPGA